MSSKTKLNYAIDVAIGLSFIVSALSGLILFFAPSGYQGGRNPYYLQPVLFLTTHTWNELHTWGSIVMIAGVGAHLVLHWNWMVCVTLRLLKGLIPTRAKQDACPIEG
jgi:cytochrome b subunit of formate dehydrogenase